MDWVDKPKNYKDLYGILQLLRGSHLNNFPLKTLKLGWVAFHSVTSQLKCLDSHSNRYKKLVPVLSRFCNGLYSGSASPGGRGLTFLTLASFWTDSHSNGNETLLLLLKPLQKASGIRHHRATRGSTEILYSALALCI